MAEKKQVVGIEVVETFNSMAKLADDGVGLIEPTFYKPGVYRNPDHLLQFLANTDDPRVIDHRTEKQRKLSITRVGPHRTFGWGE